MMEAHREEWMLAALMALVWRIQNSDHDNSPALDQAINRALKSLADYTDEEREMAARCCQYSEETEMHYPLNDDPRGPSSMHEIAEIAKLKESLRLITDQLETVMLAHVNGEEQYWENIEIARTLLGDTP